MNNWTKATLASAGVLLVVGTVVVGTAVAATEPARPHGVDTSIDSGQPASVQSRRTPAVAAPGDSAVGSSYTPIAPCRIVDTRVHGGAIRANHTRTFAALGTSSFKDQGGQSCAIPASATAVTGSVIATGAAGSGYLTVYAYKAAAPVASFLNFTKSLTLSASGTIPITAGSRNFTVKASGHATQVVIQLTGYYIAPLWARINPDGTTSRGSRVVSATHVGTGDYQVEFDRNVSGCNYTATAYYAGNVVNVQPRSGNANAVFVHAAVASSAAPVDTAFYLAVTC